MKQLFLKIIGVIFLVLGGVGLFIPVWPTTPFVIASAGCLACAPRMRARIMRVPFFRAHIENYAARSGLASGTLVVSLCYLWGMLALSMALTAKTAWVPPLLCAVGIAVSVHLLFVSGPRQGERANVAAAGQAGAPIAGPAAATDSSPATAPIPIRNKSAMPGVAEAAFDTLYLCAACYMGVRLLSNGGSAPLYLAGVMALVLAGGDAFHLLPRIALSLGGSRSRLAGALGMGKAVTSVTMTLFYMLLWRIGLLLPGPALSPVWTVLAYVFALARIILCSLPQNRWKAAEQPRQWAILRNIPFFALGGLTALLFAIKAPYNPRLVHMWLAIAISFSCYAPVALYSNKYPALGSLMLPKSCAYLWLLSMFLPL